jgi:hypothetical protein
MVTIYKNIFSDVPFYATVKTALTRIKDGKSKEKVDEIRRVLDKERAATLKKDLPSVCFSGKFQGARKDAQLIQHSGFIVLDFDNVSELREKQTELISSEYVFACWVSPSGNGLKALVKVADGKKHRQHFTALREIFTDCDKSGVNEGRVCYESYDPEIYINEEAKVFTKFNENERYEAKESISGSNDVFQRLLKWLTNRNDAFVTGERNIFIFKLASACCRFGIPENEAAILVVNEFLTGSTDFTKNEADKAVKSAYRANRGQYGSANFEKDILVDRVSRKEVQIDPDIFNPEIRPKDVIYGEDIKLDAINIYKNGYPFVAPIGIEELDRLFKSKRGEITCLTGIGNYGKSTFKKWYQTMRILLYGEKYATFSPEDNPPEEYYHDYVEILLGCDCTPTNPYKPSIERYNAAFDFISKHIFYIYPKDVAPTPQYIKERFLELIIKEKVDGVDIDPFNQLANDYSSAGGRTDKYLETFHSDISRFAQVNNVFAWIIAHPTKMKKGGDGNYECPDVFDIADGSMWNNKMDNILVYHRPHAQSDPSSPACEFHSKKVRRQKVVGVKGAVTFEMVRSKRRFFFDGVDPIQKLLNERDITFTPLPQPKEYKQQDLKTLLNEIGDF